MVAPECRTQAFRNHLEGDEGSPGKELGNGKSVIYGSSVSVQCGERLVEATLQLAITVCISSKTDQNRKFRVSLLWAPISLNGTWGMSGSF